MASLAVFSVIVGSVSFSCLASRLATSRSCRPGPEVGAASVPSRNRDTIRANNKDQRILARFLKRNAIDSLSRGVFGYCKTSHAFHISHNVSHTVGA